MIQKKWFRIETDASGAILSCEEVSSKGRPGAVVRYYEALTKADACKQARRWSEEQMRLRLKLHADRRAKGSCFACDNPALPGKRSCAAHGGDPAAKRRALERFAAEKRDEVRRELLAVSLEEVLNQFDNLGAKRFRVWVTTEISARLSEPAPASSAARIEPRNNRAALAPVSSGETGRR